MKASVAMRVFRAVSPRDGAATRAAESGEGSIDYGGHGGRVPFSIFRAHRAFCFRSGAMPPMRAMGSQPH